MLLVFGVWWKKHHLTKLSIIIFAFFSLPFLSNFVAAKWESNPKTINSRHTYGIVLCGMMNVGHPVQDQYHFNSSVDRITEAIRLYNDGMIDKIIISGGSGTLGRPELQEAPRLASFARDMGVKPKDIIVENQSRNTHQNAEFCATLVQNKSGILITSALHMRRALGCFAKEGLNVTPYPVDFLSDPAKSEFEFYVPSAASLVLWNSIIKEMVGYGVYALIGYI